CGLAQALVRLAEALDDCARERLVDAERDEVVREEVRLERLLADAQGADGVRGRDARRCGTVVDERHLADVLARPERRDVDVLAAAVLDPPDVERSLAHDDEALARLALLDDEIARLELDHLAEVVE